MAYMTSAVKADYEAQLAAINARLVLLDAAITQTLTGADADIKSHEFNSNEGQQKIVRRDLSELNKEYERLSRKKSWLTRILGSGQAVGMRVNRWGNCG